MGPRNSEQNSWGDSLLGTLGDIGGSIVDNAGNLLGAGAAAGFAGIAADKATAGIDRAMGGVEDRYNTLQNNLAGSGTFKPYTVSSGAGSTSFDNGALQFNAGQQGLTGQLQSQAGMLGGELGRGIDGLGNIGQQAFTGSAGALGADSGGYATGLGQEYAAQGQQLLGSQVPQGLSNLQTAFATQGLQAPQTASQGLQDLTAQLQGQASQQLGQATPTAQGVYDQMRAMQSPDEERQRLALENRMFAQGRMGVATDAYGGTPEQFAMDKAQAEARNTASLQAMQTADTLASSQQTRASQLAELGMSAEGIQSQLASEGLDRTTKSAQTAGEMAKVGSDIQGQQQLLGKGLLGLGLDAQEIGGRLGIQDLEQSQGQFDLGQQASMLPYEQQAAQLANILGMLGTSYMPEQQLAVQNQQAIQMAQLAQAGQLAEMQASNNLGEANLQRYTELALGRATPDVQYINAVGNIGAGMFSGGK